jgi:hypothetical protein
MRVEFLNGDGGDLIHVTQKDDINSFVNFIKSVDVINIHINKEEFYRAKLQELLYDVFYDEDNLPVESLKVYIDVI